MQDLLPLPEPGPPPQTPTPDKDRITWWVVHCHMTASHNHVMVMGARSAFTLMTRTCFSLKAWVIDHFICHLRLSNSVQNPQVPVVLAGVSRVGPPLFYSAQHTMWFAGEPHLVRDTLTQGWGHRDAVDSGRWFEALTLGHGKETIFFWKETLSFAISCDKTVDLCVCLPFLEVNAPKNHFTTTLWLGKLQALLRSHNFHVLCLSFGGISKPAMVVCVAVLLCFLSDCEWVLQCEAVCLFLRGCRNFITCFVSCWNASWWCFFLLISHL